MNSITRPVWQIPYLGSPFLSDFTCLSEHLKGSGAAASIGTINWLEYPYAPQVRLYAGYSDTCLWLCYEVKGDFFRAAAIADQDAVWEDCCVEFFVSTEMEHYTGNLDPDKIVYRNFEFNLLGVAFSASGTKNSRELLGQEQMDRILRFPELRGKGLPEEGSPCDWGLCVAIPLDMIGIQNGSRFKGNFQKCGDLTRIPHFLTWSAIASEEPDFHLPRFFGEMELMS